MDPAQALGLALLALGGAFLYSIMEPTATPASSKLAFVQKFGPIALDAVRRNAWPLLVAPLLIAWAAMESDWGSSKLAVEDFNLYGVKAGPTWIGQGSAYVSYSSKEFQGTPQETTMVSNFRKYASWAESLNDLLHMLSITTIYKPAYDALGRGDVQGFYQAIDASGYSTASKYSDRVKNFLDDVGSLA